MTKHHLCQQVEKVKKCLEVNVSNDYQIKLYTYRRSTHFIYIEYFGVQSLKYDGIG